MVDCSVRHANEGAVINSVINSVVLIVVERQMQVWRTQFFSNPRGKLVRRSSDTWPIRHTTLRVNDTLAP